MADIATAVTYIALAASAVGTGVSYYQQQQAADTQRRMAEYNYAVAAQNAEIQSKLAQYQAEANAAMAEAQLAAGLNNAQALRQQAGAVEAQGREDSRRQRTEFLRLQARQRARQAKSGIVAAGTPLEILAETAGQMELTLSDAQYQTELERRSLFRQADLQTAQAGLAGIDKSLQLYRGEAARVGYRMDLQRAEIARLAGMSDAQGTANRATATLFSGISSLGSSAAGYRYQGMI